MPRPTEPKPKPDLAAISDAFHEIGQAACAEFERIRCLQLTNLGIKSSALECLAGIKGQVDRALIDLCRIEGQEGDKV